jgi:hypothetical protein
VCHPSERKATNAFTAQKDDGLSGAPVLDLMKCRVRLFDVIEHTEPYTVTKKSTGAEYQLDPQFECTVEILNDYEDGSANGTKFYEGFRYTLDKDGEWHNNSNSKLGQLTQVVKPGYFDDHFIAPLSADDLEGFEMICRIEPKKNPGHPTPRTPNFGVPRMRSSQNSCSTHFGE